MEERPFKTVSTATPFNIVRLQSIEIKAAEPHTSFYFYSILLLP